MSYNVTIPGPTVNGCTSNRLDGSGVEDPSMALHKIKAVLEELDGLSTCYDSCYGAGREETEELAQMTEWLEEHQIQLEMHLTRVEFLSQGLAAITIDGEEICRAAFYRMDERSGAGQWRVFVDGKPHIKVNETFVGTQDEIHNLEYVAQRAKYLISLSQR